MGALISRLTQNGEVMMSTINNMEYEKVFLSALGRCWKGYDILENDQLKYQIYTYEVGFPFGTDA